MVNFGEHLAKLLQKWKGAIFMTHSVVTWQHVEQGSHTFNDKKFQDFSRTFQDLQHVFPGPCRSLPIFKYKDKQQLLIGYTECNPMHKYFEIYRHCI